MGLHDPLRQARPKQTGDRGQGPGLALPWPWQRSARTPGLPSPPPHPGVAIERGIDLVDVAYLGSEVSDFTGRGIQGLTREPCPSSFLPFFISTLPRRPCASGDSLSACSLVLWPLQRALPQASQRLLFEFHCAYYHNADFMYMMLEFNEYLVVHFVLRYPSLGSVKRPRTTYCSHSRHVESGRAVALSSFSQLKTIFSI